jgi:hypothetical protein
MRAYANCMTTMNYEDGLPHDADVTEMEIRYLKVSVSHHLFHSRQTTLVKGSGDNSVKVSEMSH